MEYIIIFNPRSRDCILHTDYHGFVDYYMSYDDAVIEAVECLDGKDYREYQIFEREHLG